MSTRKTAASGQHRRYGHLIARTAALCPKATAIWNLTSVPSQRQIRGIGEGVWMRVVHPHRLCGRLIAHTAALWSGAACAMEFVIKGAVALN
jgi:hypothetical protein